MSKAIKWAARLPHVREVSLLGQADFEFWRDRLAPHNLQPAERDGRAELMIVTAAAKFMGLAFQELSLSVVIAPPPEATWQKGAFLLRAFNSRWLFAFSERTLFSTPYYYGQVRASLEPPVSLGAIVRGEPLFEARMAGEVAGQPREPIRRAEEHWKGPIFLPDNPRGKDRRGRYFVAELSGKTLTFPFLPDYDTLAIRSAPDHEVFQALLDSRFAAGTWSIRANATHAKSKTYALSGASATTLIEIGH